MIAPLVVYHLSNGFREVRAGVPRFDHERLCCFWSIPRQVRRCGTDVDGDSAQFVESICQCLSD